MTANTEYVDQEADRIQPISPRIDIVRAAHFITQISQAGPDGKRSCALTSQLNACIAVDALDQSTAIEIQDELTANPQYDRFWMPAGHGRAWTAHPYKLAEIAYRALGLTLPMGRPMISAARDLAPTVETHLQSGGVAWMSGRSAVAAHARIAFEPADMQPGILFVHDPHYPDATGLYSYYDLPRLQSGPRAILY